MDEIIESLVSRFKKIVPDNEERLIKAFREYLIDRAEFVRQNSFAEQKEQQELIQKLLFARFADRIIGLGNIDSMKKILLNDPVFEQFRMKSGNIFKIACEKLRGQNAEDSIDVDKEIEQLKELIQKVEPFNYVEAKRILSEDLLDAEFIKGTNINIESIRLHGERERLKSENKEGVEK